MGLKEIASFARFITMGAVGTEAVARDLRDVHGHSVVELERYAMSNKLWMTKIKRLRLPDLMCVSCGRRFESKGKTNIEVRLSHSNTPGREWDAGMRDEDVYAFVAVALDGSNRLLGTGPVAYFSVEDMRAVWDAGRAKEGQQKSQAQGSERDWNWPITLSKSGGQVVSVNDGRIQIQGPLRRQTIGVAGNACYVEVGDLVLPVVQPVGGVIERVADVTCSGNSWDYIVDLSSASEVDRYAAVRAAGVCRDAAAKDFLFVIAEGDDDQRIRLEAMASLSFIEDEWTARILDIALDASAQPEMRMEAVLILSELSENAAAAEALAATLASDEAESELRAAAAWGLGGTGHARFDFVWPYIDDADPLVRRHAVECIDRLPEDMVPTIVASLAEADDRAVIAASLLARAGRVAELLAACKRGDSRAWALHGLGLIRREQVADALGSLPPEFQEPVEALWRSNFDDWTRDEDEALELTLLRGQNIRTNPMTFM